MGSLLSVCPTSGLHIKQISSILVASWSTGKGRAHDLLVRIQATYFKIALALALSEYALQVPFVDFTHVKPH